MKTKLFTLTACAAFLLAGCSNNDKQTVADKGDTKSAFLKINTSNVDTNGSRAVDPTATGTTAVLYNALIYFIGSGADPIIYDVLTAGATGADLTLAQLEAGVLVPEVSADATQVYIVGNYDSADAEGNYANFDARPGQTLSAVTSVLLDIEQVSYGQIADGAPIGRMITVMNGRSVLDEYDPGNTTWTGTTNPNIGDLYANVTLSPIVSRLEIVNIAYTGSLNFTLEGIYINNVYLQLPLSLTVGTREVMNNGSDVNNYDVNEAAFKYTNYSTLYDLVNQQATGTQIFTPVPAGNVWAYQIFGDTPPVPHIILKLTNVTTAAGDPVADQYVTVTGYENNTVPINRFDRNTVYKINTLAFTDDDLTLQPEPEVVNVWVHVDIEPWTTVITTPII